MKTLLLTVSLGVFIGAAFGASTDILTRSSRCLFDVYKDGNPCQKDEQRIPIPCESECANYYECDTKLQPKHQHCFYRKKFNATTLECSSEEVNCKWFEEADPITTVEPTKKEDQITPKLTTPAPTTAQPVTTTKSDGIPITSSALLLLLASAFATVTRGFF